MNMRPEHRFLKDSTGVIHVGASFGQERDVYADAGLPVIWIEANPDILEALQGNLVGRYANQKAIGCLITDKDDEEYRFGVSNNNGYSSSIFPLYLHKEVWPHVYYSHEITLKSKTLTSALQGEDLTQFNTLILDVQGAELKALEGAKDILKYFKYIRAEAHDFEAYEGGCFDYQLDEFLQKHGFQRVQTWEALESSPGRGVYEILHQRATTIKNTRILDPVTKKETWARVGVITSVPRVGFQVHEAMMHAAFGAKGWPVVRVGGAYWEQGMQGGLNTMIKLGCDYIITVDFDSIFSALDVEEMLVMAARYPEADAIASWQPKRQGNGQSLIGLKDEEGRFIPNIPLSYLETEVSLVHHTVFGLTLIKSASLLKMPKPWLQSFPNADGEWDTGKIDADGYFWDKWGKTGLTIYTANNVKIGQLEEYIRWTGPGFQVVDQQLSEFYKKGRPF
jgi:FkbM family methyltransferase